MNKQWLLAQRPTGLFTPQDFELKEVIIPELTDEQFLVRVIYLSLDPAQRMWAQMDTYLPAVAKGEVMRCLGMGVVIKSRSPAFKEGDVVQGMTGWQTHVITDGRGYSQVPAKSGLPLPVYLGPLGMTGITAYFGLLEVGKPENGETLLVSAAAGAVGSVVCQIGKIKGLRVVGLAGTAEKCRWLKNELGIDEAINYRDANAYAQLKTACPKGIDICFENVGGKSLDMALGLLNVGARVPLCGYISEYASSEPGPGVHNLAALISKRAKIEGFLVLDYVHRSRDALSDLGKWLMDGRLKYNMDINEGFESLPEVINKLFEGKNTGKLLMQISAEPE
ncbi:NADP-dependent oxidoreductase [Chromatiales bacterium (ex Bugula neritina AB1)]|nr:NADP-dependent oxidoreductase [Chromatiales bacterium (ex Bugula neritina AB1)]